MHFHDVGCEAKTDWVKKTDAPLKVASHHETVNKKFAKARAIHCGAKGWVVVSPIRKVCDPLRT